MSKPFKRLAKKSLKKNKGRTTLLYITITITITLFVALFSCVDVEAETIFQKRLNENGTYQYEAYHITSKEHQFLIDNPYVTEINTIYTYGTFENGLLGYIDKTSLLPFEILEGEMPNQSNEIALEASVLNNLNQSLKVGDIFEFTYRPYESQEEITESFILSGIIKNGSTHVICAYISRRDMAYKVSDFYQTQNDHQILMSENVGRNYAYSYVQTDLSMLKGSILMVIWVLGAGIIMNVLSGLAQSIEKELRMLRGIGASKTQVASLVFYQVLKISIVAFPFGFALGYFLSFIYAKALDYTFIFNLESTLNVLMISILTIFIGMSIPTIKAANISLQGSFAHHRRQIRVKENMKLTPFNLARRHIRFKRWQNALLIFVIAVILSFITSNDNLTKAFNLPQNYVPIGSFADMEYKPSGLNVDYQKLVDDLNAIEGIKQFEYFTSLPIDLKVVDAYYPNFEQQPWSDAVCIPELNDHYYELFQLEDVDREEFNRGDVALIYLPKKVKNQTPDGYTIISEYNPLLFDKAKGDEIFVDENIHVRDDLPFSYHAYDPDLKQGYDVDMTVKIAGIVVGDKSNFLDSTESFIDDYDLIVSPAFMAKLVKSGRDTSERLFIHIEEDANYNQIVEEIETKLSKHFKSLNRANVIFIPEEFSRPLQMKFFFQYIVAISVIFLLLYQQCITKISLRKKESGMYQAVGMEKSKLIKVFIYEGLIIGLTSVLLSILFKCLPSLIEIANDTNLTLSDFRIKYVFPPTIRWICLGIYVFVIAIFFIIYYFPTKNLLKEKMLDRVKYKE